MEVRVTLKDSCGSCVQYKDVNGTSVSDDTLTIFLSTTKCHYTFYNEHRHIKLSNIKSIKIIP